MRTPDALEQITRQRVLPVLRSRDPEDAVATARACAAAGMRVIELTQSTAEVEVAVRRLVADDDLVVGVGTVSSPTQVRASVDFGASFVVSYGFDAEVAAAAVELGIEMIPGALTPTEVAACHRAGASAVKLFPARLLQPAYLRDLQAVLPGVGFVVTGGIAAAPTDIRPWLDAGAIAVGIGGALGAASTNGADEVERRCREVLAGVGR